MSDADDVLTIMAKASFVQTPWEDVTIWSKQQAKRKAALALQALNDAGFRLIRDAALREPTDEMCVAALTATFDDKVGDRVHVSDVPIIWHAMIDVALAEKETK